MYVNPYTFDLEDAAERLLFTIQDQPRDGGYSVFTLNEVNACFGWDAERTQRVCAYLILEELIERIDTQRMRLTRSGRAWLHMSRMARTDTSARRPYSP